VPSGNFTPPVVVSISPETVSFEFAVTVPIPTFPEVVARYEAPVVDIVDPAYELEVLERVTALE
jgi:hypothetical protein